MIIEINFTSEVRNDSLQIGDHIYYVSHSSIGGFDTSGAGQINNTNYIGQVIAIVSPEIIRVEVSGSIPGQNDFIMFAKDSSINLSGIIGYYAEVKIENNSPREAEIFSIGSEISLSSK